MAAYGIGVLVGQFIAGMFFAPLVGAVPTLANNWLMTERSGPPPRFLSAAIAVPPCSVVTRRI